MAKSRVAKSKSSKAAPARAAASGAGARGVSLHIGLNSVDPKHYGGWSGDLVACEFDGPRERKVLVTPLR